MEFSKLSQFTKLDVLQKNSETTVRKAQRKSDNLIVVIKSILLSSEFYSLFTREIYYTRKLTKNKGIVNYVDDFQEEKRLFLVTEYCNGGDLEAYLKKKKIISEKEAVYILSSILDIIKSSILFNCIDLIMLFLKISIFY